MTENKFYQLEIVRKRLEEWPTKIEGMITSAVSIMVKVVSTAVTCLKLRHYFAMINHITTSFSVWQMVVQCPIRCMALPRSARTHILNLHALPGYDPIDPCSPTFPLATVDWWQSKQKQTNKLISFVHWLEQFFFYVHVWISESQS